MTLERKGNVLLVLFLLYGDDVNELTEELKQSLEPFGGSIV